MPFSWGRELVMVSLIPMINMQIFSGCTSRRVWITPLRLICWRCSVIHPPCMAPSPSPSVTKPCTWWVWMFVRHNVMMNRRIGTIQRQMRFTPWSCICCRNWNGMQIVDSESHRRVICRWFDFSLCSSQNSLNGSFNNPVFLRFINRWQRSREWTWRNQARAK